MENKKDKDKLENLKKAGIAGGSFDTIQRYGSANKEHLVAYGGVDNETGKTLTKSLKSISESKVNPKYKHQNIQQQAGFSAEVKSVARENAEAHINGDKTRTVRTDDMGRVNDQYYDTVKVDEYGNEIEGSGRQMKFLGNSEKDPSGAHSHERALDKIEKMDKYHDKDIAIEVPSEQYEPMLKEADKRIENWERQLKDQEAKGNTEQAEKLKKKIAKEKKIKCNLRKSKVSSAEARFARNHPTLSTAVDIAKVSHRAGMEAAQTGAAIGAGFAVLDNLVSLVKGDKDIKQASKDVAKATAKSAATGYVTGAGGAAVKGVMQNSSSAVMRAASKTGLPGAIVSTAMIAGKSIYSLINGDITAVECLEQMGQEGANMVSSALFATIGQIAIPIPVVGALAGSMIGYAFSAASFGLLKGSLQAAKAAREERIAVEKACDEYIARMEAYKREIEEYVTQYLAHDRAVFREAFMGLQDAYNLGDTQWFIDSANTITEHFGGKVAFRNEAEFDALMESDEPFRF